MTETEFKAVPRFISEIPQDTDISNAHAGAEALRLPLLPQGELVAGVLEAKREDGRPKYSKVIVQIPRRSTKTTSIQNTLLGRCFSIAGHRVVSTAQTQAIARKVFLEMVHALEVSYPDADNRPFKARIGNGQEEIRWDNGSVWWIVAPRASAFRSQAADDLWFDEAGEYSGDQTADLVEGALPLMDTRPAGQVIISGTPPKVREGMLWDYLQPARAGKPRYGIVDFSMDPADDPTDEAVWWKVHAGLASGLTDIEVIRERFESMPLLSFQREYLCADPLGSSTRAIAEEDWLATLAEKLERPASNFAVAYDVAIDGSAAAIAAAWYEDDIPCVQVLAYRGGDAWLAGELAKAIKAHPAAPVGYDAIGNNVGIAQSLSRFKVRTDRVKALTMKEAAGGVSLIASAIKDHALKRLPDKDLDRAVEGATYRFAMDNRLFGRRSSAADISPLVACTNALFIASGMRQRQAPVIRPPRLAA